MNPSMSDVGIVLVGLNAKRYVVECIESLYRAEWSDFSFEIIYVDNGSKDGSVETIHGLFPAVKIIANATNLGFCKAANQGAKIARSRYLLYLNDDTLVYPDSIPLLVRFIEIHPNVGVVGARLLNTDLTDQWSGRRFPSPLNGIFGRRSWLSRIFPGAKPLSDYLYREQVAAGVPFEVDWVSAAALLVKAETFEMIGGFAQDYYYWHEAVFCDRIRRTGQRVFLDPRSNIIHHEGKGSGARPYRIKRWHIIDFHRGAYRCYCEHHNYGRGSLARWFAAVALGTRAMLLLAAARLKRA
jgi:N-acetylglucosaminyl-diphospho-decaprenol L-rhamnosyltransferase